MFYVKAPDGEITVPNAPCGVERSLSMISQIFPSVFLMHRVELKDSFSQFLLHLTYHKFLMHRVELKVLKPSLMRISGL